MERLARADRFTEVNASEYLASDPILTAFLRDEVLVPLERKRQEVVCLWAKFGHLFPDESISAESPRHVPQISLLLQSVQQAEAGWSAAEDKKRFKRRFNNFIKHMDDHSYLFEVIPSGDKYVSLITGVVSSVVKVYWYTFTFHLLYSNCLIGQTGIHQLSKDCRMLFSCLVGD